MDLLRSENANTDAVFRNLPKNANYQSQESQNELLKVVADTISETIINDIKASGMFSVIADEARDISCSEQMSICIRFVKEAAIYERFISFVNVHELSAVSLAAEIVKNLQELNLTLSQCVAQCYELTTVQLLCLDDVKVYKYTFVNSVNHRVCMCIVTRIALIWY